MRKLFVILIAIFAMAACDNQNIRQNTFNPSIGADTAAMIIAAGSNFSADSVASLSTITMDGKFTVNNAVGLTNGGDVVLRSHEQYLFVINRSGADSIQLFDVNNNLSEVANYSVGAGSNPQDVVIVGDKAYISRLGAQNDKANPVDVLIVDMLTGKQLGGIDLKSYMADDGDKLARAVQMVLVGNLLYVACQDLSSMFVADANGKVAVINTDTDEVEKVITLAGRNPFDLVYLASTNKIFVTNAGVFDPMTYTTNTADGFGGIEVIDVDTNETMGIKIDDAVFGGNPSEIRLASDTLGYFIVSSSVVATFNPTTFELLNKQFYKSPDKSPFSYMPDILITGDGKILLTERDPANSGILVLNSDGTVNTGPLSIGALPASLVVVEL